MLLIEIGAQDVREVQFVAFSVATSVIATTNVSVKTVTEDKELLDKPVPTETGHAKAINVPIRTTNQKTIATNPTRMGIDAAAKVSGAIKASETRCSDQFPGQITIDIVITRPPTRANARA